MLDIDYSVRLRVRACVRVHIHRYWRVTGVVEHSWRLSQLCSGVSRLTTQHLTHLMQIYNSAPTTGLASTKYDVTTILFLLHIVLVCSAVILSTFCRQIWLL